MASSTLTRLPAELVALVLFYLANRDIKNLRLTCGFFRDPAHLRFTRVFLSPNPLNISVFRAIADHETLRRGVREIIWDDARLTPEDDDSSSCFDEDFEVHNASPSAGVPRWFAGACKVNIGEFWNRKGKDVDTAEHAARAQQVEFQLPLRQSWLYYQALLEQEQEVAATGADIDALRHGLQRFSSLKIITITAAAHGVLYNPLYETPMIRAFPNGFNYALPGGWLRPDDGDPSPTAYSWENEVMKHKWRGYRVITRELAQQEHQISEFIVDAHLMDTGLNCRIFDRPCEQYNNLVTILRRPGFKRIDLDLMVGGQHYEGWPSFRRGLIGRALGEATDLEHVNVRTNVVSDLDGRALQTGSGGSINHHIPLRSIFPTDKWSKLRHLGLSGFLVQQADVLSLLASLPQTIRSVELSFLYFLDGGGNYRDLLVNMRDNLDWRHRAEDARPKVTIGVYPLIQREFRAIWVDREVYDFLYRDGENPFGYDDESLNQVSYGNGTVRDAFDPAYERPWLCYHGPWQVE